jgi:hypothetical protein
LGIAVAASSAFPVFSAVAVPASELQATNERSRPNPEVDGVISPLHDELPNPLLLSDGGIVDNIGLTSILAEMAPEDSPDSFYLVASDAGAALPHVSRPPLGRLRKLSYIKRQLDIQGSHNNDMTTFLVLSHHRSLEKTKGMAIFRIDRAVPHAGETLD